jgi:hypothetical protein
MADMKDDLQRLTDKQKLELYYATPILKHLGYSESVHSSDSPDLLIDTDGKTIGVEIVSCYPDEEGKGSFSALVNRAYSVCREYSAKLKMEGVRGRIGYISFTEAAYTFDETVSTHRFKQIVFGEIELKSEQFLYEQRLDTHDRNEEYFEKMVSGYFDCKYVESVSYHDLKDIDLVEFHPIRVGYFITIDPKFVIACIDKKEVKLSQYKTMQKNKGISEYWLFIYNPSNTFCDLEGFEMPEFRTSYDRVYVTDLGRVLRLK